MTNSKKIRAMSNKDLARWLRFLGNGHAPWMSWFWRKYCDYCPREIVSIGGRDASVDRCLAHGGRCRYLPRPLPYDNEDDILRMWLNAEDDVDGGFQEDHDN